jgi:hypothetical protein
MAADAIVVAGITAGTSIIIQGMQAWIEMARALGQTEAEIDAAFVAAKLRFESKTPDKLPNA